MMEAFKFGWYAYLFPSFGEEMHFVKILYMVGGLVCLHPYISSILEVLVQTTELKSHWTLAHSLFTPHGVLSLFCVWRVQHK